MNTNKDNAKDLAIELKNIIERIEIAYIDANKEQKRLDLLRQDVLHHMESSVFNANQGYKYAKALQIISKERRLVKDEYSVLDSLNKRISTFKDKIIQSTDKVLECADKKDRISNLGNDAYSPRIIRNIDKNDILNQVVDLLYKD